MNENLLNALSEPDAFQDFSLFCLAKNGTLVNDYGSLMETRDEPAVQLLLTAYEEGRTIQRGPKLITHKIDRLSNGEKSAIRSSLENCMLNRRVTYDNTFCSSLLFSHEFCAEILQNIEVMNLATNNLQITAHNPLIGILGYNTIPNQEWRSILGTKEKYVHGELVGKPIVDLKIDIDMYHPFVWLMLQGKKHFYLQKFLQNYKANDSFLKFCDFGNAKKQALRKKYYHG